MNKETGVGGVKPREWTLFNCHTGESRDFVSGASISYAENVKVVEKSAYDKLKNENEKLKEDCEFLNTVIKERESVNAVHLRTLNKLEKEIEELKIKLEQLEGTTQNAFERWQNALDREEKLTQDLASAKELIGKLKVILMFYSNEQNVALDAASNEYIEREMFAGFLEFFDKPLGTTAHDAVKQIESWEAGK